MLYQVLIIIYVIIAICLIGLILIQQGKGADMGASFGAGSSATIFGSSGSGNFLTRTTTYLAVGFFVISLVLGNLTANRVKSNDEFDNLEIPAEQVAPAAVDAIPSDDIESAVDAIPSDEMAADTMQKVDTMKENAEQAAQDAMSKNEDVSTGDDIKKKVSDIPE